MLVRKGKSRFSLRGHKLTEKFEGKVVNATVNMDRKGLGSMGFVSFETEDDGEVSELEPILYATVTDYQPNSLWRCWMGRSPNGLPRN